MQYRMAKVDITAHTALGEVVAPSELGLNSLVYLDVAGVTESGYGARWNGATTAAGCKIVCWMGDNNNASDGPFVDASTADVGEVFVIAYGY